METDPYFWTQDNGAGAPVHFATTYKQLDMLHHVLRHAPSRESTRSEGSRRCIARRISRNSMGIWRCLSTC